MIVQIRIIFALALVASLAGCSGDDPFAPPPNAAQAARLAPALAVAGFAVVTGSQGRGIFDNGLPCVRRGVANYVNSTTGRDVTFTGCRAAPGIVLNGSGRLEWTGPSSNMPFCPSGLADSCASTFRWAGSLHITLDDSAEVVVDAFEVRQIVAGDRLGEPRIALLSSQVGLAGAVYPGGDSLAFEAMFDMTGMSLATLPNPNGSPAALRDEDLARIAYHLAMELGFFLIDETVEAGRGNHTHTQPCGTTVVTIDGQQLPHLQNDWHSCNANGVFVDGDFTMAWGIFDASNNALSRLRMDLDGDIRLGGAVPELHLTRLRWTVSGSGSLPGTFTVALELVGPSGSRTWARTIALDD